MPADYCSVSYQREKDPVKAVFSLPSGVWHLPATYVSTQGLR